MSIKSQARLMWSELARSFGVLARIQFDAPWRDHGSTRC